MYFKIILCFLVSIFFVAFKCIQPTLGQYLFLNKTYLSQQNTRVIEHPRKIYYSVQTIPKLFSMPHSEDVIKQTKKVRRIQCNKFFLFHFRIKDERAKGGPQKWMEMTCPCGNVAAPSVSKYILFYSVRILRLAL